MQKPKKRKVPQSKKTRLKKLGNIAYGNPMQALYKTHQQQDLAILNKIYEFEMTYCIEESKKVIDAFFIENGYQINQKSIFVPEKTVLKAYNYSDLMIGLKMQQFDCEDWDLSVETHFYNLETHEQKTVPYFVSLNGIGYFEIYQELKIKVDRGAGIKTRWRGFEKELEKTYAEANVEGFSKVRTEIHLVGKCKFKHIDAYEEFKYLQDLRDNGTIEEMFEKMYQDAVEQGYLDEKLQPLKHENTGLPMSVIRNYREKNKPVYF